MLWQVIHRVRLASTVAYKNEVFIAMRAMERVSRVI